MTRKDKPKHGGAREGSGRKPDPSKKIAITKKLDRDIVEYLQSLDNATLEIETCIRKSKGFKAWLAEKP